MINQGSFFDHWQQPKKVRALVKAECLTKDAEAYIGRDLGRNRDYTSLSTNEGYYMAEYLGKWKGKRYWRIWWVSAHYELAA